MTTEHEPTHRRTLSGRRVPIDQPKPESWVHPARLATGGAKADPDHPSRKHDTDAAMVQVVTPSSSVQGYRGPVRRRVRRMQARTAARRTQ